MIHSLLFVPAKAKMLAKIPELEADAYILDLEDSIAPDKKAEALAEALAFLEAESSRRIYVRVDREIISAQIDALRNCRFEGYMLPKFEQPEDFRELWPEISRRKNIALTETPMGLVNLKEIASCSWVSAIAFGAEDYTSCVGMENSSELLTGIKSMIVMNARAFGKECFDTPHMSVKIDDDFLHEVNISADMGFDGKLAVHPKQVKTINEVFSRRNDPEFMREVLRQYEESGGGAVSIDGKIYERMHIARFRKIIEQEAK